MKKAIIDLTKNLSKVPTTNIGNSQKIKDALAFDFDPDYLDFIENFEEINGFLNESSFISFWSIDEIIEMYPYYEDVEKCKELIFFSTDGSNLGFAFEKNFKYIVSIDFLDILDKEPTIIANSFEDFLLYFKQ